MIKTAWYHVTTYGHALYPEDGQNENTLLSAAEERLNEKKTIQILKREEHMLRAEKLRLVGELAAGMADEIRNPLTTIKGFLQIAKEQDYNIERWYPLIMDEVTRMSELTSEFLQFSRPHVTKFKTQSIQECILRVIQLTSPRALLSGHEILYSINDDHIMVTMEPRQDCTGIIEHRSEWTRGDGG